jgi:hypothetical protein
MDTHIHAEKFGLDIDCHRGSSRCYSVAFFGGAQRRMGRLESPPLEVDLETRRPFFCRRQVVSHRFVEVCALVV